MKTLGVAEKNTENKKLALILGRRKQRRLKRGKYILKKSESDLPPDINENELHDDVSDDADYIPYTDGYLI
jgi:hypothetical protein